MNIRPNLLLLVLLIPESAIQAQDQQIKLPVLVKPNAPNQRTEEFLKDTDYNRGLLIGAKYDPKTGKPDRGVRFYDKFPDGKQGPSWQQLRLLEDHPGWVIAFREYIPVMGHSEVTFYVGEDGNKFKYGRDSKAKVNHVTIRMAEGRRFSYLPKNFAFTFSTRIWTKKLESGMRALTLRSYDSSDHIDRITFYYNEKETSPEDMRCATKIRSNDTVSRPLIEFFAPLGVEAKQAMADTKLKAAEIDARSQRSLLAAVEARRKKVADREAVIIKELSHPKTYKTSQLQMPLMPKADSEKTQILIEGANFRTGSLIQPRHVSGPEFGYLSKYGQHAKLPDGSLEWFDIRSMGIVIAFNQDIPLGREIPAAELYFLPTNRRQAAMKATGGVIDEDDPNFKAGKIATFKRMKSDRKLVFTNEPGLKDGHCTVISANTRPTPYKAGDDTKITFEVEIKMKKGYEGNRVARNVAYAFDRLYLGDIKFNRANDFFSMSLGGAPDNPIYGISLRVWRSEKSFWKNQNAYDNANIIRALLSPNKDDPNARPLFDFFGPNGKTASEAFTDAEKAVEKGISDTIDRALGLDD